MTGGYQPGEFQPNFQQPPPGGFQCGAFQPAFETNCPASQFQGGYQCGAFQPNFECNCPVSGGGFECSAFQNNFQNVCNPPTLADTHDPGFPIPPDKGYKQQITGYRRRSKVERADLVARKLKRDAKLYERAQRRDEMFILMYLENEEQQVADLITAAEKFLKDIH